MSRREMKNLISSNEILSFDKLRTGKPGMTVFYRPFRADVASRRAGMVFFSGCRIRSGMT